MKIPAIFVLVGSALALSACTPHFMKKKHDELAYPGFLDVGAGYAVIPHATKNQDAGGFTASIKAYPGGRWYAPLKQTTAAAKEADLMKRTAVYVTDSSLKKAREKYQESQDTLSQAEAAEKNAAATQAKAEQDKVEQSQIDALKGLTDEATANRVKAENGVAAAKTALDAADRAAASTIADISTDAGLYQIRDGTYFKRMFVFYGRSIGGYGSTVDGEVDSIGLGYDITPEFGLIAGHARYSTLTAPTVTDTDEGLLFGVQLNLNAFQLFRGIKAD